MQSPLVLVLGPTAPHKFHFKRSGRRRRELGWTPRALRSIVAYACGLVAPVGNRAMDGFKYAYSCGRVGMVFRPASPKPWAKDEGWASPVQLR